MADDPHDLPAFDAARLAAEIRKGDQPALALAYRQLFDSGAGRLVLGDHLAACGVGNRLFQPGMSAEALFYAIGRHDAAIELASRVYDPAALAVATLTGEIEENTHAYEPDPQGDFTGGLGDLSDADDLG